MRIEDCFATAAIRICAKKTDPLKISAIIPLRPTRITDGSKAAGGEFRWIYESTLVSAEIEPHIDGLIGVIELHRAKFDQLPEDCEIDIWCTISSAREFVGLSLSRKTLERAAALNLELIFG